MATEQQWAEAVEKLLDLTKNRTVKWEDNIPARRPEAVGPIYITEALSRHIAIYEFEYPYYDTDTDSTIPMKDVAIEFVKSNGELEYRWPKTRSHFALLNAVRFNVVDAQGFLDTFLSEEFGRDTGTPPQATHS